MRKIFIPVIILSLLSCMGSKKKSTLQVQLTEAGKKYYMSQVDSSLVVDSFKLEKVDTLSPKKINSIRTIHLGDQLTVLEAEIDGYKSEVDKFIQYKRLGISYSEAEVQQILKRYEKAVTLHDTLLSRAKNYLDKHDRLDSTTFLNYYAQFRVVVSDKRTNVQKTHPYVYLIITPALKIVKEEDYLEPVLL